MSLNIINIVARATLASVDIQPYEKVVRRVGDVLCEIKKDGSVLLTQGKSVQACRDAAAQCGGMVTSFEVLNVIAQATLARVLDLTEVAETIGSTYDPVVLEGIAYCPSNSTCNVLIFGNGTLIFVGCTDTDHYEQVLFSLCDMLGE